MGLNNIDVAAATRLGILVTNTPGVVTESTADFAWALLMAAARRVAEGDRFVRSGHWKVWKLQMLLGHDVYGKTLGIIGFGNIGKAVARRARGFRHGDSVLRSQAVRVGAEPSVEGARAVTFETLLSALPTLFPSMCRSSHDHPSPQRRAFAFDETELHRREQLTRTRGGRESVRSSATSGKIAGAAGSMCFEREPEIEPEL